MLMPEAGAREARVRKNISPTNAKKSLRYGKMEDRRGKSIYTSWKDLLARTKHFRLTPHVDSERRLCRYGVS